MSDSSTSLGAGTAADQLRRILLLIPQLADGESHAVEQIAARLGVDRKTLRDDIISLATRFDEPGGFVAGVSLEWDDREVSAFTTHFLRPMRLTIHELCALELGLAIVRRERAPEEWGAIDRALARLREAITKLPTNDWIETSQHAELDAAGAERLALVRRALGDRRKLKLVYRAGSAGTPTTRTVAPYSLVFAQGMWYLVAYCEQSEGLRFFRLDRIERAEATIEGFEVPSDFSVEQLMAGDKAFHAAHAARMTVRYSPRIARWIAEREGAEPAGDGSLTLEHPLADRQWAIRHVLQYGPDAEVLEPAALRAEIAERLERMREALG